MVVALVFSFPTLAISEAPRAEELGLRPGEVRISGLTLYCPTCTQSAAGYCEMAVAGEQVMLPCDEMLSKLLREEVSSETKRSVPSSDELEEFLLSEKRDYLPAKEALLLIEQREGTHSLFEGPSAALVQSYPELLQELIADGWGSRATLSRLWSLAKDTKSIHLQALIASRHPEITASEFLEQVLRTSPENLDRSLEEVGDFLKIIGASEIAFVEQYRADVQRCQSVSSSSDCFADVADARLRNASEIYLASKELERDYEARAQLGLSQIPEEDYVALLPSSRNVNQTQTPSIFLLLLLLPLLFVSYFSARQKRLRSGALQMPVLSSGEREELRELRSYFKLSPQASETDLVKRYRTLARELHPDTGEGSSTEFSAMNERYNRAKELFSRLQ